MVTAITLDPKYSGAYFEEGPLPQHISRLHLAEDYLRGAIETDPDDAWRRITLGTLLMSMGKIAEAR